MICGGRIRNVAEDFSVLGCNWAIGSRRFEGLCTFILKGTVQFQRYSWTAGPLKLQGAAVLSTSKHPHKQEAAASAGLTEGQILNEKVGDAQQELVEALHYKPEGRGFDSLWSHCNFSVT